MTGTSEVGKSLGSLPVPAEPTPGMLIPPPFETGQVKQAAAREHQRSREGERTRQGDQGKAATTGGGHRVLVLLGWVRAQCIAAGTARKRFCASSCDERGGSSG